MSTQNDNDDASTSKVTASGATGNDVGANVALTDHEIPPAATIMTIQLTLTALPGAPRVPLELSSTGTNDSTVNLTSSELRQLVSTKTKIPLSALRLIYRGRLITDHTADVATNVITEYKLENGSVLHCMGKPSTTTETKAEKETSSAATTNTGKSVESAGSTSTTATATPVVATPATTAASTHPVSSVEPSLQGALNAMRASNSAINYTKCLKTLQKVLVNIIDHPLEEKYRTIKVNNAAFQKHFHHIHNSTTVLLACGFQRIHENTENAAYTMNASPEQWPTLLQSKATIDRAVQQSTVTTATPAATATGLATTGLNSSASTMPLLLPPVGGGGMVPDPSLLQQSVANIMSNPEQIQAMMQDPMIQNLIRNDPQLANIPHLNQALDEMMNNPQMAEGIRRMMSDPNYQRMVTSPEYMQSVQQRLQQSLSGASVNGPPPILPPNLFTQPPVPPQSLSSTPWGSTTTTTAAPAISSNNHTASTGNPTRSDDELTEEEMIAEAIRRSLQDNNNNGP